MQFPVQITSSQNLTLTRWVNERASRVPYPVREGQVLLLDENEDEPENEEFLYANLPGPFGGVLELPQGTWVPCSDASAVPGEASEPEPAQWPELFTEEEAICYLRLDTIDIAHPEESLRRYREMGLLRGTQVSKRVFYLRKELDAFLDRLTGNNPR